MKNKSDECGLIHYSKSKIFEKFDLIIVAVLVVAVAVSLYFVFSKKSGNTVEVYYKGELIETRSLHIDTEFSVESNGKNTIRISDGTVSVIYSDCENHLCEQSKPISNGGERIVCAPNGLVIIITGEEVDGVTGGGE